MNIQSKIFWLGTLAYSVLLAFSVLLFKERTVFLDISFHLFEILRTGEYAIQNNRFGSFFTQPFPLFSSQMGLSLKAVMPPALALVAWFYLSKKHYRKLAWSLAFFFGYLALVNISYPKGSEPFYMENLYLPLAIFLLVPLIFDVLPGFSKKLVFSILLGVVCLRLFHIFLAHPTYTTRLDWYRSLMERTENSSEKKLVLDQAQVPQDTLMMTWGSSYECWLLSTIETGETRSIVIHDKPSDITWAMPQKDGLLTNWGIYPYSELPERYFIFTDSTSYVFYKN